MRSLSPAVQRLAAVGILVVLLAIAYGGVVAPLIASYTAARAGAEAMRAAIARGEGHGTASDLDRQLAQVKEQMRSSNGFLSTTTDALASATLQNLVKTAVDKVHGDLRSMQILTPRDEDSARRIAVRAQFSADLAGVQRVFYDLESLPSILFLNNVQITVRQTAAAGRAAAAGAPLEVQFDIVGYMRGPG